MIPGFQVGDFDAADTLPELAAERLRMLRQQRDDEHRLVTSALEEMQNLRVEIQGHRNRLRQLREPRGAGGFDLDETDFPVVSEQAKLDKKVAELKRLNEESDLRGARWGALSALVNTAEYWIRNMPGGTAIAMHPPVEAELRRGEDILAAIERFRRRERELRADRDRVRAAPYPSSARKAAMMTEVETWAEQGSPDVASSIEHGEPIRWPVERHQFDVYNTGPGAIAFGQLISVRNFLAWWDQPGMIKRLSAELDQAADDPAALSDKDRQAAEKHILDDLLAVHRQEAETVWRAQSAGVAVMHRSDIDPAALLGVELVPKPTPIPREGDGEAGLVRHVGP